MFLQKGRGSFCLILIPCFSTSSGFCELRTQIVVYNIQISETETNLGFVQDAFKENTMC